MTARLSGRRYDAFTLIELVIVVAMLSLLVSVAAFTVRLPLKQAQEKNFIAQLKAFEAGLRTRVRSANSPAARLLVEQGRCRAIDTKGQDVIRPLSVPSGFVVELVKTDNDDFADRANGVRYDRFATSETFALSLKSEAGNTKTLLVLGLTGEQYSVDKEVANEILEN